MGDLAKELNTSFKNEWIKVGLNIIYTGHWFQQISEKELAPYDLSPQQYNVLRILRGAGTAITVNTVKERMLQKTPNTTRLMDKLSNKGLIDRCRSENDRRTVYVKITSKGLDLLNEIILDEEMTLLRSKITEEEAKTLNRLLDKLR